MKKQYIQKGNVEATELDGEWIILNTDEYTITKLNGVGGQCWALLTEVQTADTLAQSLAATFSTNVSQEEVKQDVDEFLANLLQCGLIQYVD